MYWFVCLFSNLISYVLFTYLSIYLSIYLFIFCLFIFLIVFRLFARKPRTLSQKVYGVGRSRLTAFHPAASLRGASQLLRMCYLEQVSLWICQASETHDCGLRVLESRGALVLKSKTNEERAF